MLFSLEVDARGPLSRFTGGLCPEGFGGMAANGVSAGLLAGLRRARRAGKSGEGSKPAKASVIAKGTRHGNRDTVTGAG